MVFKKCYLLAGVMLAANIFVVNEVKATDNELENNKYRIKKTKPSLFTKKIGKVCEWENSINFTVGSALSLANNYFKWWDYNKGGYWKLGCLGWRSGRFLKDCFQFDVNLNIGRGILWTVATLSWQQKDSYTTMSSAAYIILHSDKKEYADTTKKEYAPTIGMCAVALLQGSLSMPLVIHISTFDFTIALDSLICGVVGYYYVLPFAKNKKQNEEGYELIPRSEN